MISVNKCFVELINSSHYNFQSVCLSDQLNMSKYDKNDFIKIKHCFICFMSLDELIGGQYMEDKYVV